MSSSLSASPGGQPSTTQPSAGPWLSPNVVTVKSRPNVSPAMILIADAVSALRSASRILGPNHHKYPVAAALELEPDERQARILRRERLRLIADLDDQHAVGGQMIARAPARIRRVGIEPRRPAGQRQARLVPVLGRQRLDLAAGTYGGLDMITRYRSPGLEIASAIRRGARAPRPHAAPRSRQPPRAPQPRRRWHRRRTARAVVRGRNRDAAAARCRCRARGHRARARTMARNPRSTTSASGERGISTRGYRP